MTVNKKDIIKLLEKIATYMELKGENPFKISAYRKAAQAIEKDERSLSAMEDFTTLQGVGKGTAAVIVEYMEKGASSTLQQLEKEVPEGLIPLLSVQGLGGKKLAKLYKELNITDSDSLKEACEQGKLQDLKGFGKKTEEKILDALSKVNERPERLPIATVLPVVEQIETYVQSIEEVIRFSIAGSMRRHRETVKDLDFILSTDQPAIVKDKLLKMDGIIDTIAQGDTKVSITIHHQYDISIDFRLVTDKEFPTTLHHFTGSKDHNVQMRQLAKSQGKKISEYGVEDIETGEITTFEDEASFFKSFGLHFIPPELREGNHELDQAKDEIHLLKNSDIHGDLHMHTTWSDGAQSVEEMVNRAIEKGYDYIAITDHSKFLKVANGLNEERLRKQAKEIDEINEKYPSIHIFKGVEMDILPDGSLDFSDDFLQHMDFVIASIHSSFQQDRDTIHMRLLKALENPYVHMIAHPTGRLLGRREGYDVDVEWLIEQAHRTNTILELNANPNRLDLAAKWLRIAKEKGVKIAINTDAHNFDMLEDMPIGCGTARRAGLDQATVVNSWTTEQVIDYVNNLKK
ncbi:DNA polymerase/3'-5' exonuclease PolX [Gracilibacillus marinus]|jgi:DNA polymerase (family X)|uniref:DNA-directed DNA polymerase n=1 Tax=Gracilibacillus marinus TaxID=630535 RepID=A0ABV8VUX9_9BACI